MKARLKSAFFVPLLAACASPPEPVLLRIERQHLQGFYHPASSDELAFLLTGGEGIDLELDFIDSSNDPLVPGRRLASLDGGWEALPTERTGTVSIPSQALSRGATLILSLQEPPGRSESLAHLVGSLLLAGQREPLHLFDLVTDRPRASVSLQEGIIADRATFTAPMTSPLFMLVGATGTVVKCEARTADVAKAGPGNARNRERQRTRRDSI